MNILKDTVKYDRLSTSAFYNSFPVLHPSNDDIVIERMPLVVDQEVVRSPVVRSPGINARGVEERFFESEGRYERKVTFKPHNFREINHLDLAESYFSPSRGRGGVRRIVGEQRQFVRQRREEFLNRCNRELLREIIRKIIDRPYSATRYTRIFIQCSRTFECLRRSELRRAANFFLFERAIAYFLEGDLVVDILREFFTYQLIKEDLVTTNECTPGCLDYILRCCSAQRFNARRFLNYDNQREEAPFCPIYWCVLARHISISKLKILLTYGFEPLMLDLNVQPDIYMIVRMFLESRYIGIGAVAASHYPIYSARRTYIILQFLYLMCCSLRRYSERYIKISKMFFSAIPDPFVSRDEIVRIIHSVYQMRMPLELQGMSELFKDTCIPVSMPRTLKHLSRCAIRARLRERFSLPIYNLSVYRRLLGIPETLVKYLNLEVY